MPTPGTQAIPATETVTGLKAALDALQRTVDAMKKEISVLRTRELLDELPYNVDDDYGTLEELWKMSRRGYIPRSRRNSEFARLLRREQERRRRGWPAGPNGFYVQGEYYARQSLWEQHITARARGRIMEEEALALALFSLLPAIDDPREFWDDDVHGLSAVYGRLIAARLHAWQAARDSFACDSLARTLGST